MAGLFPYDCNTGRFVPDLVFIVCHYSNKLQFGLGGGTEMWKQMKRNHEIALALIKVMKSLCLLFVRHLKIVTDLINDTVFYQVM